MPVNLAENSYSFIADCSTLSLVFDCSVVVTKFYSQDLVTMTKINPHHLLMDLVAGARHNGCYCPIGCSVGSHYCL